jgi:hypothetical protein
MIYWLTSQGVQRQLREPSRRRPGPCPPETCTRRTPASTAAAGAPAGKSSNLDRHAIFQVPVR